MSTIKEKTSIVREMCTQYCGGLANSAGRMTVWILAGLLVAWGIYAFAWKPTTDSIASITSIPSKAWGWVAAKPGNMKCRYRDDTCAMIDGVRVYTEEPEIAPKVPEEVVVEVVTPVDDNETEEPSLMTRIWEKRPFQGDDEVSDDGAIPEAETKPGE